MAATDLVNILDASKSLNDPLQQGVVEYFVEDNPVLDVMPFITIDGDGYRYVQEYTNPVPTFRAINEDFQESKYQTKRLTETLAYFGGDLPIDVALARTNPRERASANAAMIKSMSMEWLHYFFKGDKSASASDEFNGIDKRLNDLNNGMVIDNGDAVLDLDALDEMMDSLSGGKASMLLMNQRMERILAKRIQSTQNVYLSTSEVGQKYSTYNGVPIGIVGKRPQDAQTEVEILDFDGGAGSSASIYAIRFGDNGVHGIQNAPIDVRDLGEDATSPKLKTRIDWDVSFVMKHPKCVARLDGITNALA